MVPVLKATRQPPDNADEFRQEFGYLGPAIQAALARARTQGITPTSSAPSLTSMGISAGRNTTGSGPSGSGVGGGGRIIQAAGGATNSNLTNPAPKQYMFVSSRPSTPVQVEFKSALFISWMS